MENLLNKLLRAGRCTLIVTYATIFFLIRQGYSESDSFTNDPNVWRAKDVQFDWGISDEEIVQIHGKGAEDANGNLYFTGLKADSKYLDSNLFIGKLNADGGVEWTRELATVEYDEGNHIEIFTENSEEYLYILGATWGNMDDSFHVLDGFSKFGRRDIVLLKLNLDGEKLWSRQFGTSEDDFAHKITQESSSGHIFITGSCVTSHVNEIVDVDVPDILESRKSFSLYKRQISDPAQRSSSKDRRYNLAASFSSEGYLLDYVMDGGISLIGRRIQIKENGIAGEYAIVLNRQPLEDVQISISDIKLVNSFGKSISQLSVSPSEVTFSRLNWNQEKYISVTAVDDDLSEDVHYATITHSVSSKDPNYDGQHTPFLMGRNLTFEIRDNDLATIKISRTHLYTTEGGKNDSYTISLTSEPWEQVEVFILPLHPHQTVVEPSSIKLDESNWNVPQQVHVQAIDDELSENEVGGLHFGGQIVHYAESKDFRYNTRRPSCAFINNCDDSKKNCIDPSQENEEMIKICDIEDKCDTNLGNGACAVKLLEDITSVPSRFGAKPLNPSDTNFNDNSYNSTDLAELLAIQKNDSNVMRLSINFSADSLVIDPTIRGFLLRFLGVPSMEQATRLLSQDGAFVLYTLCSSLQRLRYQQRGPESWPDGSVEKVISIVMNLFPGMTERFFWNCGAAKFTPTATLNVTIWDNDPAISISKSSLRVSEMDARKNGDYYVIVLNTPPITTGRSLISTGSYCNKAHSDICGYWNDFDEIAETMYQLDKDESNNANITIKVIANSQISVEPSTVTFTTENWYLPQKISVYAVDDFVVEKDENHTILHEIQQSSYGYGPTTPVWIQGSLGKMVDFTAINYNQAPVIFHSPQHRRINVLVQDNDEAQVEVLFHQKEDMNIREHVDVMDWVGEFVDSPAFEDRSLLRSTSNKTYVAGQNVLILEQDFKTYMKFHLPQVNIGADPAYQFSRAVLQLHQTPYNVFSVSDEASPQESDKSSLEATEDLFVRQYTLQVSLVRSDRSLEDMHNGKEDDILVSFLPDKQRKMEIVSKVQKSEPTNIDVTSLITSVLPTSIPVVAIRVEVLEGNGTVQLCSSAFEHKLRPKLRFEYRFQSLLKGTEVTQSSTKDTFEAKLAIDGLNDESIPSRTEVEIDPWWQANLPNAVQIGTLSLFVPEIMKNSELWIIVSIIPFDKYPNLDTAIQHGCPEFCSLVHHMKVQSSILTWEINAGVQYFRVYRKGEGALELLEVEAYDSSLKVTSTANARGLRSRLKTDWESQASSVSWRFQQTVQGSIEENIARGMKTRQSSTSPEYAFSSLGVDGQKISSWDTLVPSLHDVNVKDLTIVFDGSNYSSGGGVGVKSPKAMSTRTELEKNPWWEVDLGSLQPIRSIKLYPYTGVEGDDFCSENHLDPFLQTQISGEQEFEIIVSDNSLSLDPSVIVSKKTLKFSCKTKKHLLEWNDVFQKGRYIRVQLNGEGILMLKEVEVFRWNPTLHPRYIRLDFRGDGKKNIALSALQIFPSSVSYPEGEVEPRSSSQVPIPYTIHSFSSEFSTKGHGSMGSIISGKKEECFIGSDASYHEWVILDLGFPQVVGSMELQLDTSYCGMTEEIEMQDIDLVSIAVYNGADQLKPVITTKDTSCLIDRDGNLVNKVDESCALYACQDHGCLTRNQEALFVDVVLFGNVELFPSSRLPLSLHQYSTVILRDNPALLWDFEEKAHHEVVSSHPLSSSNSVKIYRAFESLRPEINPSVQFEIFSAKESSFFTSIQHFLPSFSLEFWVRLVSDTPLDEPIKIATVGKLPLGIESKSEFASIQYNPTTTGLSFDFRDPSSLHHKCSAELKNKFIPAANVWYNVVASYHLLHGFIRLSIHWREVNQHGLFQIQRISTEVECDIVLDHLDEKEVRFGSSTNTAIMDISTAAWYLNVLDDSSIEDHVLDFYDSSPLSPISSHSSYALRLASRPLSDVVIDIDASIGCYQFNLCNVSVSPSSVTFTSDNWNEAKSIHVLGINDQLYEHLHRVDLDHAVRGSPSYKLTSFVNQLSVDLSHVPLIDSFFLGWVLQKNIKNTSSYEEFDQWNERWMIQEVDFKYGTINSYDNLDIATIGIQITDSTIGGVKFSTNALFVSEDGKGHDYQVVLRSEPKELVEVLINGSIDCYRPCFDPSTMSCPSTTDQEVRLCTNLLCNVTVVPEFLYFSKSNWSLPQTVRVFPVDDFLDEADIHVTVIHTTTKSLDTSYNNLDLPEIFVEVADNDVTQVLFSASDLLLSENSSILLKSGKNITTHDSYGLRLTTEPWSDVTIAMDKEGDGTCYRSCGYHFDGSFCGLPRVQSVNMIRIGTNSSREIQEIHLETPRVTDVQKIITYVNHQDQIFKLKLQGGYTPQIWTIEFAFTKAVARKFPQNAIGSSKYGKSFRIVFSNPTTDTVLGTTDAINGFANEMEVEEALHRVLGNNLVAVSRMIQYPKSLITWRISFLRLLDAAYSLPRLSLATQMAADGGAFEGSLTLREEQALAQPTGNFLLRYGQDSDFLKIPIEAKVSQIEQSLRQIEGIYDIQVSRTLLLKKYGFEYRITFISVAAYGDLVVHSTALVSSAKPLEPLQVMIEQIQPHNIIGGFFVLQYFEYDDYLEGRNETDPISWDVSAEQLTDEIMSLAGIEDVSVSKRQISPEGAHEWTIEFVGNVGKMPMLHVTNWNLTGSGASIDIFKVRDGEEPGGFFVIEHGGVFKRESVDTQDVYNIEVLAVNSTLLPFNSSVHEIQDAIRNMKITQAPNITREPITCDIRGKCLGYTWILTFNESPGDIPELKVYGDKLIGKSVTISSRTVANGTYLSGKFSLYLELAEVNEAGEQVVYKAKTWNLPVNVTAEALDEALEAIPFVTSDREAEYDYKTGEGKDAEYDKGVRVFREGPYPDGGHTWRLEWSLKDYIRFVDLKIEVNDSLITQEVEPPVVPSRYDLNGVPRCNQYPSTRFESDKEDPFGLRGTCVYDQIVFTNQDRFLCNYTIENPWITFNSLNWCESQTVQVTSVDDFLDETTEKNGNTTISNILHNIRSDDARYHALRLPSVQVQVFSDDLSGVDISESALKVSEDGVLTANYWVVLKSEPYDDVVIKVLPWLEGSDTKCYRFGLCNLTVVEDTFVFTPGNWDIPQQVVVLATDDSLDEDDEHMTGISHIVTSRDPKYDGISASSIDVVVKDNDISELLVLKKVLNVTEGGAIDEYEVVLATEPFAKVTVRMKNEGEAGSSVTFEPKQLAFSWRDWNVSQVVRVNAVDDVTEDPADSFSLLIHSITTNDLIYANLKNLPSVKVNIEDNDVSGIELSSRLLHVEEGEKYSYSVRLLSEPWHPVVIIPNADHDCYMRVLTSTTICNATILSEKMYFDEKNWNVWQQVHFEVYEDHLEESPIHYTNISHASQSQDPLYNIDEYSKEDGGCIVLEIEDNDRSFVVILLALDDGRKRERLQVAEGGFNDTYSIVLQSEPYEEVRIYVEPNIEEIYSGDDDKIILAPQVSLISGSLQSALDGSNGLELVFTSLDWYIPKQITVYANDDKLNEEVVQFTSIHHRIYSFDENYNISSSSIGLESVQVKINDREAIAPPLLQTAIFDSTGTKLTITFDSIVYHAATMRVLPQSTNQVDGFPYPPQFKFFSCDLIFDFIVAKFQLGEKAKCFWIDGKQLHMELGTGATIMRNDVLLLRECKVYESQICKSPDVVRARHYSRGYSQSSIRVETPPDIVTPRVMLVAPEEVGSCGSWTADASLSSGAGGRPYSSIAWFAVPSSLIENPELKSSIDILEQAQIIYSKLAQLCIKYEADWKNGKSASILAKSDISAAGLPTLTSMDQVRSTCYFRSIILAAESRPTLRLVLNSNLLKSSSNYIVGLSMVNAFGLQGIALRQVSILGLPGPAVSIVGDSNLDITRVGESLLLQATATVACPQVTGTNVIFRWEATLEGGGDVDFNSTNSARDPRMFRIPRTLLKPDQVYRFKVYASIAGNSEASTSTASVKISVKSSPLIAKLLGGNRALGERDTLLLNASSSLDPDGITSSLNYQWDCEDITNSSLVPQPCLNASVSSEKVLEARLNLVNVNPLSPVLRIPPFTLQPSRNLHFFVKVSKTNPKTGLERNSSTSTLIWTTIGSVPEVSMSSTFVKVSPMSRLQLNARIKSMYPYNTRWIEVLGDLGLPSISETNVTTHEAFLFPLTSINNVIMRNELTPGMTYVFRLVATDINGNSGFGSITIKANSPPISGTFYVTPDIGEAVNDEFSLECAQWADDLEDFPLTYSFGVMSSSDVEQIINGTGGLSEADLSLVRRFTTPLVPEQLAPQALVTMLPPSMGKDSENYTLIAFISDTLGSTTFATTEVQVLTPIQAKTDPVGFVSDLFTNDLREKDSTLLLSAAFVMRNAFVPQGNTTKVKSTCPGTEEGKICSSHGSCDPDIGSCVCNDGYMGFNCQLEADEVRKVNDQILSSLKATGDTTEPSPSGLSQQALVLDTVIQSTGSAFDENRLADVTDLTSIIAQNAFGLQDHSSFIEKSGLTLMNTLSSVLSLGSSNNKKAKPGRNNLVASTVSSQRRLTEQTPSLEDTDCSSLPESLTQRKSNQNLLNTLQFIAALSGSDLAANENPVKIDSNSMELYTVGGKSLNIGGSFELNLTEIALECLEQDLYLNAFIMEASSHSLCSLNDSSPISSVNTFTIHSKKGLDLVQQGNVPSIPVQELKKSSGCVKSMLSLITQDAANTEAPTDLKRRRLSVIFDGINDPLESNGNTITDSHLLSLSISHKSLLSPLQMKNFTTVCRAWDFETSVWSDKICIKNDQRSNSNRTVCYCDEVGTLEVLVTLEERLAFYEMLEDLYRHDQPSWTLFISLLVVLGFFTIMTPIGNKLDTIDAKKKKELMIKSLNRAKWDELQARIEKSEMFDVFYYTKAQQLIVTEGPSPKAQGPQASMASFGPHKASIMMIPMAERLENAVLPFELRTLYATAQLEKTYHRLTVSLLVCNALLLCIGGVILFIGVDFYLVLGNSTSEILLYVMGKNIGLVSISIGAILILISILGLIVSKKNVSHIARHAYLSLLLFILLSQLICVGIAYKYLEELSSLHDSFFSSLKDVWLMLEDHIKGEIQNAYGCCGFASITDAPASLYICPEEALDAIPPRTCFHVLSSHASVLFQKSFRYILLIFGIEIGCIASVQVLLRWRSIRLLQLAAPSNSDVTSRGDTQQMFRSMLNVILYSLLPSLYTVIICIMIFFVVYGLDMVLHRNFLSNPILTLLFGMEMGSVIISFSMVYLFLLIKGAAAIKLRDWHGFKRFLGSSTLFFLVSVVLTIMCWSYQINWDIDAVLRQLTRGKYLLLPDKQRFQMETALVCCGFDSAQEERVTCLKATDNMMFKPCSPKLQPLIRSFLLVWTYRLIGFTASQCFVLVVSLVLHLRMRKFNQCSIKKTLPSTEGQRSASNVPFCAYLLAGLNVLAGLFGLVIMWIGIDVLYQLNILQLTYLLTSFDRHIAIYLLIAGGLIELFSCLGLTSASGKGNKRVLMLYWSLGLVLFIGTFGFAGVMYRFKDVQQDDPVTAKAVDVRLRLLWTNSSSNTKHFIQNYFHCCGYSKQELILADGSKIFQYTEPLEVSRWQEVTETQLVPETSKLINTSSVETVSIPHCPTKVNDACGVYIKKYITNVADMGFKASICLLVFLLLVLLAACRLLIWSSRSDAESPYKSKFNQSFSQTGFIWMTLGSILVQLALFFFGLDIFLQWQVYSSRLFQVVYQEAMGITVIFFASVHLLLNLGTLIATFQYCLRHFFFQLCGRFILTCCLWISAGIVLYYSSGSEWQEHLAKQLDKQWSHLPPSTQHLVALEYSCCGFHDPLADNGRILFDRSGIGYECPSLDEDTKGCKHALLTQAGKSFHWLGIFLVVVASFETVLSLWSGLILRQWKQVQLLEWFAIESRVRYAIGKYKKELSTNHVIFSLKGLYDEKLTRFQRMISIFCTLLGTLMTFVVYFATQGCHVTSLRSCQQFSWYETLWMALVFGGIEGFALQSFFVWLYKLVKNRRDRETQEAAAIRQRKEKILQSDAKLATSTMSSPTSTLTTEEKWYVWLLGSLGQVFFWSNVMLFIIFAAIGCFMSLVLLGYEDVFYNVHLDTGPQETLIVSGVSMVVVFLAVLAIELAQIKKHTTKATVLFIFVSLVTCLLMACIILGVQMSNEIVNSNDQSSFSIRKTKFSVIQRLETGWKNDSSGFFRNRVQHELHCCGFHNATDFAFLPCPQGDFVDIDLQADRVDGSTVKKRIPQEVELQGCFELMLSEFQEIAHGIIYTAIGICLLQTLVIISGFFTAYDLMISKDAKLRYVGDMSAFEKVGGLKIAAPGRGKILASLLSSSLESVPSNVVKELGNEPLAPLKGSSIKEIPLKDTIHQFKYPSWIVYPLHLFCLGWCVGMGYLIFENSLLLGEETATNCLIAWLIGICVHVFGLEPTLIFGYLIGTTLKTWWDNTWCMRLYRYGKAAFRVCAEVEESDRTSLHASILLYTRIRHFAATRIQRRVLTRLTHCRFVRLLKEKRELASRQLALRRKEKLRRSMEVFTKEEIQAFQLLFNQADVAKMGLIAFSKIPKLVYQLGVRVSSDFVQQFLYELDPAYADLVDFDHFLFAMQSVREYHQEQQQQQVHEEEAFISPSMVVGPKADLQAKLFVKRQNVLREAKEQRESLQYRLIHKMGAAVQKQPLVRKESLPPLPLVSVPRKLSIKSGITTVVKESNEAINKKLDVLPVVENQVTPVTPNPSIANGKLEEIKDDIGFVSEDMATDISSPIDGLTTQTNGETDLVDIKNRTIELPVSSMTRETSFVEREGGKKSDEVGDYSEKPTNLEEGLVIVKKEAIFSPVSAATDTDRVPTESIAEDTASSALPSMILSKNVEALPSGAYILLENVSTLPKKKVFQAILKKQSQEETSEENTAFASSESLAYRPIDLTRQKQLQIQLQKQLGAKISNSSSNSSTVSGKSENTPYFVSKPKLFPFISIASSDEEEKPLRRPISPRVLLPTFTTGAKTSNSNVECSIGASSQTKSLEKALLKGLQSKNTVSRARKKN